MNSLTEREDNLLNAVTAALGIILLISPWLIGFDSIPSAYWTAIIGGAIVTVLAFAAFVRLLEWEEWVNLAVGLCIAVSPWVIGFAAVAAAAYTHLIIGALVALLAAFELARLHGTPPARST